MSLVSGSSVGALTVLGVEGNEALSELYRYVVLVRADAPLGSDRAAELLNAPAALTWGDGWTHGIVSEVRAMEGGPDDAAYYRVVLVPTVHLVAQNACEPRDVGRRAPTS